MLAGRSLPDDAQRARFSTGHARPPYNTAARLRIVRHSYQVRNSIKFLLSVSHNRAVLHERLRMSASRE